MTGLRFDAKAFAIPHPDKAHYGGEDAYCCDEGLQVIAVADGVGGFDKQNEADVADYSRSLVREVRRFFKAAQRRHRMYCGPDVTPQQAIDAAHKRVRKQGASTICVARLNTMFNTLDVASVGDSRAVVYRSGQVYWSSDTQQHYFNCPFQLGYPVSSNTARDACVYRIPLKPGDVVVIGSDGLWDNVWDEEVMQHLPKTQGDVQEAAECIANAALDHAVDDEYYSPFAAGSFGSSVDWPCGGKPDDITVVVARVISEVPARVSEICSSQGGRGSPSLSISSTSTFDPCEVCSLIDETTSGEVDDASSCCSSAFEDTLDYLLGAEFGANPGVSSEIRRSDHCYWAPQPASSCHHHLHDPRSLPGWGYERDLSTGVDCSAVGHQACGRHGAGLITRDLQQNGLDCAQVHGRGATASGESTASGCVDHNSSSSDVGVSPFAAYLSKCGIESHETNNLSSPQLSFGNVPSNITTLLLKDEYVPEKSELQTTLRTGSLALATLPSHTKDSRPSSTMQPYMQPTHFGSWRKGELEALLRDCMKKSVELQDH